MNTDQRYELDRWFIELAMEELDFVQWNMHLQMTFESPEISMWVAVWVWESEFLFMGWRVASLIRAEGSLGEQREPVKKENRKTHMWTWIEQ